MQHMYRGRDHRIFPGIQLHINPKYSRSDLLENNESVYANASCAHARDLRARNK